MRGARRDPLSVRYDGPVRRALEGAVDAHARRRGYAVWVASPPAEFRNVDRGGRTMHERAFTRSAYYQVRMVPYNSGVAIFWSLRLTWGPIAKRKGKWGRVVTLRLYRAYAGRRHVQSQPVREAYTESPETRSSVVNRVDHADL